MVEVADVKRACSRDQLLALAEREGLAVQSGRFQCPARCSDDPRGAKADDTPAGAMWECKRCASGGSVVDLLMLTRDLPLAVAIQAAEAALALAPTPPPRPGPPPRDADALWAKLEGSDAAAEAYLRSRGLDPEKLTGLVRYNVGSTGDLWLDRKAAQGFRVVVALRDLTGRLVSFQLRTINPAAAKGATKLSLPGISTSQTAFVRDGLGPSMLCEGMFDTLTLAQAFPDHAVLGAPGADQLKHLSSFVPPGAGLVRLWPQNDAKSREAFATLADELTMAGCDVQTVQTPATFKDPAECWATTGTVMPPTERPPLTVVQGGAAPQVDPEQWPSQPLTNTLSSLCSILRSPQLRRTATGMDGDLGYNEMTLMPTIGGVPVDDVALITIRERCELHFKKKPTDASGLKFNRLDVGDAVLRVAKENSYHPVRSYLDGLRWDGTPRIDSMQSDFFGTPPNQLTAIMLRKWMIGAVARVFQPGCQMDAVLVLVGRQGMRKSSFFRALAGDGWFSDSSMTIGDKDSYLVLRSTWIVEWAELEAMQRAKDQGTVKSFITSRADTIRLPYGRVTQTYPRSCVIVGTTNDQQFLSDPTGNRRYWTVDAPNLIPLEKVMQERDQLWAEAVFAYRASEGWHLDDEQSERLASLQQQHEISDPWEPLVRGYVTSFDGHALTTAAILEHGVQKPRGTFNRGDEMRVAGMMSRIGFRRERKTQPDGTRPRVWVREPDPF